MEVGSRLEGSYAMALNIWINRFKTSQKVIRDMENDNAQLAASWRNKACDDAPQCGDLDCLAYLACATELEPEEETDEHAGHDHD